MPKTITDGTTSVATNAGGSAIDKDGALAVITFTNHTAKGNSKGDRT